MFVQFTFETARYNCIMMWTSPPPRPNPTYIIHSPAGVPEFTTNSLGLEDEGARAAAAVADAGAAELAAVLLEDV